MATRREDELAFESFIRILHRRFRMPDGREAVWDLVDAPPTVAVLALTPDRDVVMVEQFRPGPERRVLSVPRGLVDEGETVSDAAARELREETGYAGRIEVLTSTHLNARTRPHHVAVAWGCELVSEQSLDDFEDCTVVVMSLASVRRELRRGSLGAGVQTYLALDHLDLL
ncbi:MAG: NUDIX hydrolase [Nocardioides sp.]